MKRLMWLACWLVASTADAQHLYWHLGVSREYPDWNNVNRQVYVYNYTRQWLTQPMAYFGQASGVHLGVGNVLGKVGMRTELYYLWESNEAYGLEPATGFTGYRVIRWSTFGTRFCLQYLPITHRFLETGLEVGLEIPMVSMTSRYRNPDLGEQTFDSFFLDVPLGWSIGWPIHFYPLERVGLLARPYVHIPFRAVDVDGAVQGISKAPFGQWVPDRHLFVGILFSLSFADSNR